MDYQALFPGFDYIGASDFDGLVLKMPAGTEEVLITLGTASPEILHLQLVRLLDSDGREINCKSDKVGVSLSSVYNNDDAGYGTEAIRAGRGFHTAREHHPVLRLSFPPALASQMVIHNRPDEYGRRSSTLVVSARSKNAWSTVYLHADPARLQCLLSKISGHVRSQQLHGYLISGDAVALRKAAMTALVAEINETPQAMLSLDWILPLLDIYGGGSELDVTLLSAYYACLLARGTRILRLTSGRKILAQADRLIASERKINELLVAAGFEGGYLYTRHGLQRSRLAAKAEHYLDLARRVCAALKDNGVDTFLSYGTLLGARREGGFIPHDDDMDIVFVGKSGVVGSLDERERVIECLQKSGFKVTPQWPLLNFHVSGRESGVSVDLFPSWIVGDQIHLYMEKMVVRPVALDLILPLQGLVFCGASFDAPRNVDGFLVERYGDGWPISDRFFEWQYPLTGS